MTDVDENAVFGYVDDWTKRPGDLVTFHLAADRRCRAQAQIVRLTGLQRTSEGESAGSETIGDSSLLEVQPREMRTGAYLRVDGPVRLAGRTVLEVWVKPTFDTGGHMCVVSQMHDGVGWSLSLDDDHFPFVEISDGRERRLLRVQRHAPLDCWSKLVVVTDLIAGATELIMSGSDGDEIGRASQTDFALSEPAPESAFLIGALTEEPDGRYAATNLFAGMLAGLRLWHSDPAGAVQGGDTGPVAADQVIAAWDFSTSGSSLRVGAAQGTGPTATPINLPVLGLPGPPSAGPAVRLHRESVEDAAWPTTYEWQVPDELPSGVYALKVIDPDGHCYPNHFTFFVVPPADRVGSGVALLIPTLTFHAYVCDRQGETFGPPAEAFTDLAYEPTARTRTHDRHPEFGRSLYDKYEDGCGVYLSSRLRPAFNIDPEYAHVIGGFLEHLGATLYTLDWLNHIGQSFDTLTDHLLDAEGLSLIERYQVVILGAHPEYSTSTMNAALREFFDRGGRIMYLGGNGLWEVIGLDPDRRHVAEIRRGAPPTAIPRLARARAGGWTSPETERTLSTTGERGGRWEENGFEPGSLLGLSSCAMGFASETPPYVVDRSIPSFARFVVEGLEAGDAIGIGGRCMGGAASFEVDEPYRTDHPDPLTARIATASGYPSYYERFEVDLSQPVRSAIVLKVNSNGGAVFSVGAIGFAAALSEREFGTSLARMTANVLNRFKDGSKFELPAPSAG